MHLTIHVVSDIHLEHRGSFSLPETQFDILCLCGDIGNPALPSYKDFLSQCAAKSSLYTFVIMGNHEAYGKTLQQTADMIQTVCDDVNLQIAETKVVFLNNACFDLANGYRVIGTTLWSNIVSSDAWHIRTHLSDFSRIKGWSIGEVNDEFAKNVVWLRCILLESEIENKKVVIMTHHAPLLTLGHPKHLSSPLQSAFASDLEGLISKHTHVLKYWFYGHNHYSQRMKVKDTVILSNQVGYSDHDDVGHEIGYYDPALCVSLESTQ